MSLTNALSIGRSGLLANQAALEVAGNNLANAATAGYTRQTAVLTAAADVQIQAGMFVGTGAKLQNIIRNIDTALEGRLRAAISDQQAATTRYDLLSQIEAIHNELGATGLSGRLDEFFASWSELANNIDETSLRTLVVQQGGALAEHIRSIHNDLSQTRNQLDDAIRDSVNQVNGILEQIATLNDKIITVEGGTGGANGLRDQRDQLISELAEYVDISTFEQEGGAVDIFIGGIPLVSGTNNRGMRADFSTNATTGELEIKLRVDEDGTFLYPTSGKIGELINVRASDLEPAIDALDQFAGQLIWQVNRLHSQGQGAVGLADVTGTYEVADSTVALTDVDAELDFTPVHGSFKLHVTQQSTNPPSTQTTLINVDLDGIGGADMSLDDLVTAINAQAANVTASVTVDGKLRLAADSPDYRFSFSEDSSGVLAALGINTFFTGKDGSDIGVNATLMSNPALLATAGDDPDTGDPSLNGTAKAIRGLQDGLSELWSRHIEDFAVRTSQASLNVESNQTIVDSLRAQRESVSGVSVDEEAINLMAFQRAYQGSARFLSVVDELMQTLLGIIS